jgi:pyruvate/2-oxoglutarate dehydrogenase complex dihydrolipoamide dehydrogenase (E3) component
VRGDKAFLDLGEFSTPPALPGLAEVAPLTHVELLDLVVPQHLLTLGGGCIALELAQATRRLGSRVTVCEGNERILGGEDPDSRRGDPEVAAGPGNRVHHLGPCRPCLGPVRRDSYGQS